MNHRPELACLAGTLPDGALLPPGYDCQVELRFWQASAKRAERAKGPSAAAQAEARGAGEAGSGGAKRAKRARGQPAGRATRCTCCAALSCFRASDFGVARMRLRHPGLRQGLAAALHVPSLRADRMRAPASSAGPSAVQSQPVRAGPYAGACSLLPLVMQPRTRPSPYILSPTPSTLNPWGASSAGAWPPLCRQRRHQALCGAGRLSACCAACRGLRYTGCICVCLLPGCLKPACERQAKAAAEDLG